MKLICMYCKKKATDSSTIQLKKGMSIHIKCLELVDKNISSPLVSLNTEVEHEGQTVELINLLPDIKPTDERLSLDLRLIVETLSKKGKIQEARALQYFINGLSQSQMSKKFKRNKQRVSQIVISLRKELFKLGISEVGYIK